MASKVSNLTSELQGLARETAITHDHYASKTTKVKAKDLKPGDKLKGPKGTFEVKKIGPGSNGLLRVRGKSVNDIMLVKPDQEIKVMRKTSLKVKQASLGGNSLEGSITEFLGKVAEAMGKYIKDKYKEGVKGFRKPFDAGYMEAGVSSEINNTYESSRPGDLTVYVKFDPKGYPTVRVFAAFPKAKPYSREIAFKSSQSPEAVVRSVGPAFLRDLDYWMGAEVPKAYRTAELLAAITAASKLTLRQVKSLMKKHSLPGELKGRGTDWELEVKNESEKKKVEKVIKGLGGYKTGYGGWVLSQDHKTDPVDFNSPSSKHHYARKTFMSKIANLTEEVRNLTEKVAAGPWPTVTREDEKVLREIAFKYNSFAEKLTEDFQDKLNNFAKKMERDKRAVLTRAKSAEDKVTKDAFLSLANVLDRAIRQANSFFARDFRIKNLDMIGQADYQARWIRDPFRT